VCLPPLLSPFYHYTCTITILNPSALTPFSSLSYPTVLEYTSIQCQYHPTPTLLATRFSTSTRTDLFLDPHHSTRLLFSAILPTTISDWIKHYRYFTWLCSDFFFSFFFFSSFFPSSLSVSCGTIVLSSFVFFLPSFFPFLPPLPSFSSNKPFLSVPSFLA